MIYNGYAVDYIYNIYVIRLPRKQHGIKAHALYVPPSD